MSDPKNESWTWVGPPIEPQTRAIFEIPGKELTGIHIVGPGVVDVFYDDETKVRYMATFIPKKDS